MKNGLSKITLLLLFAIALLFAGCATPLTNAAERGNTKEMERLIASGANVNERASGDGWSPLHCAAWWGQVEAVRLLLKNGADPNIVTDSGETPLEFAKKRGHFDIVSLLEKAKIAAKTDQSSPAEETAFAEAASKYRAAAVKPTLPEEARKFALQAAFALNKKEFEKAAELYKEALKIAPWWPDGHSDRAQILGELFRYRDAIKEMKRYLTLVPDAPDARAAQDRIYQWEGELK